MSSPDGQPERYVAVASDGLRDDLDVAVAAAAAGAEVAIGYFHTRPVIGSKGDRDLVSEADCAVEELIVARLRAAFPDDVVIGEESGSHGAPPSGRRRWYVDPIDGTTNFLKGLPLWGVSVGLCDADDRAVVGAVVLPALHETYTATRGGGARRDGVPIRASQEQGLDRLVVAHSQTRHAAPDWGGVKRLRDGCLALAERTLGTRMSGCACFDLTAVACGRIDVMWGGGLSKWDVAAGLVIAAEAGAEITDVAGRPVQGPCSAFVASPAGVHEQVRALIAARPLPP